MWKDIDWTEGRYSVSDRGEVRSNDRLVYNNGTGCTYQIKGKILRQYKNNKGYLYVDLCISGIPKRYLVHRLVAETFIENPNNYPIINHKDCNPLNNTVENLEWCTYQDNIRYCVSLGRQNLQTEKRQQAIHAPHTWLHTKVRQYSLNGDFIQEFESLTAAANWLVSNGITKNKGAKSNISACCKGKNKTSYGYKWEYANNEI